jgi:hypothetical protein
VRWAPPLAGHSRRIYVTHVYPLKVANAANRAHVCARRESAKQAARRAPHTSGACSRAGTTRHNVLTRAARHLNHKNSV